MGHIELSRRAILKTSVLAGGGLMLGLRLPSLARGAEPASGFMPNAFVKIDPAGAITLIMPNAEVGQGIHTAAAMLIAEELEVGLDQVKLEAAPPDEAKYADPLLGEQATGGSTSVRGDWVRLREAGATARTMLVAAAAKQWKVDPATCQAQHGAVLHKPTGRTLPYGALVAAAAALPVPETVKTKEPSEFKLIGTTAKRLDTPPKVNGTMVYGIDAKVDGMKIGTLAICPVRGGKVAAMNEAAARSIPGVRAVLKLDDGSAVAVVGDHMWAAKQGLERLAVKWDSGANAGLSHKAVVGALAKASENGSAIEGRKKGDAQAALSGAATRLSAIYELPFLSHAPMEPVHCLIPVRPGGAFILEGGWPILWGEAPDPEW